MQTKSSPPIQSLKSKNLPALVKVYYEFNQLKQLYRQGWLKRGISKQVCESVAEHTLGVTLLCMWIADQCYPQLDSLKVMRMALLHDFGEIYAGDITPVDDVSVGEKARLEMQAVTEVFSGLPGGDVYIAYWQEFEDGATAEARFVRQIDRLEMAFQAGVYTKLGLETPHEFLGSARKALTDNELIQILDEFEKVISIQSE